MILASRPDLDNSTKIFRICPRCNQSLHKDARLGFCVRTRELIPIEEQIGSHLLQHIPDRLILQFVQCGHTTSVVRPLQM